MSCRDERIVFLFYDWIRIKIIFGFLKSLSHISQVFQKWVNELLSQSVIRVEQLLSDLDKKTHSYLNMLSLSEEVKNPSAGICLYKEHLTENIVDLAAKMFEFSLSTRK